ncbi:MAG: DegT/DnrJ/EryC1/StrS family aminotransferase [Phycisphaerae bacterium]|nr:DegT/DnrJ/EryC1/StrS family aminotransferase [Phycisphaerae bacterium]HJN71880.1 DegT/DnrJ/EryC1/StrS family aminotransferase [Phycisphaerales bacterium]
MSTNIPLSCADITEREILAASDALRGETQSLGPWTKRFEKAVASQASGSFAIAFSSASCAMQSALETLGVGQGNEVIVPTFDSPSTTACVLRLGAIPVFADCDARSLNCDVDDISAKITSKTKAIVASHVFGNPTGIDAIAKIAMKNEIHLLEDAGQAIGSKVNSRPAGSFGRVAVFAFHSTTQLTSLEGGVIVTDDDKLANSCQSLRNHGLSSDPLHASEELHQVRTDERLVSLGHSFRLSEVHAAVGATQMKRIDEIMERRGRVADWYTQRLGGVGDVMCPTIDPQISMSWDGYVIRLNDQFEQEDRDHIIRGLHRHEIGAADYFRPVHTLPPVKHAVQKHSPCPVSESISARTLALPFFTSMTKREVDIVCQTLELMMTRSTFAKD